MSRQHTKRILCFGDSNTWGYKPGTGGQRYLKSERWSGILAEILAENCEIIEEGLNGRTTVWDDPIAGYQSCKNGKKYLVPCLESHKPLELVIMMLGSNDLKKRFSVSAFDIAEGAGVLVDIVLKSSVGPDENAPKVLLMAPPCIGRLTEFCEMLEGAEEKSMKLSAHYRRIARERGCEFFDTSRVITSSDADGVHLEVSEHAKLAQCIAPLVRKILG